jgi:hypothetical protein
MKRIYVLSGGTMVPIRPHFSLCAPAYGTVGRELVKRFETQKPASFEVVSGYTSMALSGEQDPRFVEQLQAIGRKKLETNDDVEALVDHLITLPDTKVIVMALAMCDWQPTRLEGGGESSTTTFGKEFPRLHSRQASGEAEQVNLSLEPTPKVLNKVRRGTAGRKDIFLVSFKTVAGISQQAGYARGLLALKRSSSNLVLVNDIHHHTNTVVTPEEFPYHAESREQALDWLVEMTLARAQLHFVRTHVRSGQRAQALELDRQEKLPPNFVPVVRYLLEHGAYKLLPEMQVTTGHFGCRVTGEDYQRIASVRKENHNLVFDQGMAKIFGTGDSGKVEAEMDHEQERPSVGEHTQAQIYQALGDRVDSIVHFHCPLRSSVDHVRIPVRAQRLYECGSVECGENTIAGMSELSPGIWAVHLEGHGPNVAFHRSVPAQQVIEIIAKHWDLADKTGGRLALGQES